MLNDSDLGDRMVGEESRSEKITENIRALNKITDKINDFTSRCSNNIKN